MVGGKSTREKCSAASEMETQNTPRKLFCLIKIKENCWEEEEEVCLRVLESRLRLHAPVISGRPCVCVCVFESPEGCIKLKWQWGSLRCLPKFAIEGDLICEPLKQQREERGRKKMRGNVRDSVQAAVKDQSALLFLIFDSLLQAERSPSVELVLAARTSRRSTTESWSLSL